MGGGVGFLPPPLLSGYYPTSPLLDSACASSNRCSTADANPRPAIQADLAAGTTVIIDRYYYSGCVYSAAKQNPSLTLEWCRHPEVGLPRPDLCLFLDISAAGAAKRGGYGTEKYEKKEMQDRVRELFGTMMGRGESEEFVRVDAGKTIDEVAARIREEVDRCVERVAETQAPLRTVGEW